MSLCDNDSVIPHDHAVGQSRMALVDAAGEACSRYPIPGRHRKGHEYFKSLRLGVPGVRVARTQAYKTGEHRRLTAGGSNPDRIPVGSVGQCRQLPASFVPKSTISGLTLKSS